MNCRQTASVLCGALSLCLSLAPPLAAQKTRPPRPIIYPPPPYVVSPEHTNVRVEIVTDGIPTFVYRDGPYRWIEGRQGQRFAFRITNDNPFPVGVIPSADGHSLTAEGRARADQPAYVIDPYGTQTISLWREDLRGGRQLVFTDVDQSLAARKGDRRNIGVLGVLVWQLEDRERRPVPLDQYRERDGAAKAPGASGGRAGDLKEDNRGIGVGAGEHITDPAYLTTRYRRVRVLGTTSIYYDDRDGLRRAGVDLSQYRDPYRDPYWDPYKDPYPDRRQSDPFPDSNYHGVRIPD